MIRVSSRSPYDSDETECAICLEDFPHTGVARIAYCHCRLRYHVGCINMWVNEHGSCPSCRQTHPQTDSIRFIHDMIIQYETILFGNVHIRYIIIGCSLYVLVDFVSRNF